MNWRWAVGAGWLLGLAATAAFAAPGAQRVISLLPSATESLCALGACSRLVATDDFSNFPASVRSLPKLGGLDDVPIERILALKPDLVVAAPNARVVGRLRSLGVKVLPLPSDTHAELEQSLMLLAQATGVGDGAALWRSLSAGLAAAAAKVPAGWRGQKVVFEVDEGPWVAGASSYIGQTLSALGLGNVAGPELGAFPKLNPEYVLRSEPGLIMIRQSALAELQRRPAWRHLRVLKAGRVCAFDEAQNDLLVRPGPRLAEGAEAIVACLQRLSPPP